MYKILSRTLLTLAISALLLISLLPELLRWQAIRALAAQGIELEINYLGLALRKGEVQLDGLRIKDQNQLDVAVSALTLQLSLLPLLDKEIVVSNFKLRDLTVKLSNNQELQLGSVELDGDITVLLPNTAEGSTQKDLSIEMLEGFILSELALSQGPQSIVQIDAGEIRGLQFRFANGAESNKSISLTLSDIALNDISILGREHLNPKIAKKFSEHISLAELRLNQLAFQQTGTNGNAPSKLSVHSLSIAGLNTLLLKVPVEGSPDQNHRSSGFPLVDAVQELQTAPKPAQAKQKTNKPQTALQVSLKEFQIGGGSRFTLIDTSHTPATTRSFEDITIQIDNINQAKPKEPSTFSISAKTDEYGSLAFQGDIKPFLETVNASITGQVKSLDLSPLSAYAETSAAHRIKSGHLNADIKGTVADNKVDVQVLLDLRKFYLENLNKQELPKETKASTLPLATALNLLRDNDDRIEFKLPISGDVYAPDFSIQYILGIVARKAITETVINYYTPFGLVGVTSALVSSATQLQFEPVQFSLGENSLANGADKNVDKLATLLTKRQKLTLTLCPFTTAGDWRQRYKIRENATVAMTPEQFSEMEALGVERGALLKKSLVEKNVSAEQVIVCKATVNNKENSAGFVSIEL